jgi:hypothetical protein
MFLGIAYGITAFIASRKEKAFINEFKKYLGSDISTSSADEIIGVLKKKNIPESEILRAINIYYSSRFHPPLDKMMQLTSIKFEDARLEQIINIINHMTESQFSIDGLAFAEIVSFEFPGFEYKAAAHSLAYTKLYTELYRDKYYSEKEKKKAIAVPENIE